MGVAQLVRAPDCGSGCRGFESLYPPHRRSGIGKRSQSLISFSAQGCRQVVRQGTLTPSSAGSSPAVPARNDSAAALEINPTYRRCDPVAQSAEQLPFKQWVRGSNPRRVTKKTDILLGICLFAVGDSENQMGQSGGLSLTGGSTPATPYAVRRTAATNPRRVTKRPDTHWGVWSFAVVASKTQMANRCHGSPVRHSFLLFR